jgi:hypothetical protein
MATGIPFLITFPTAKESMKSLEDKFDSVQQFVELGSVGKFHIFLGKVEFEFDQGGKIKTVLRVIWLSR